MPKQRKEISLGVRVIIVQKDKILVVRQRKPNGRYVYILPGGGVKEEEDVFTAAERETREESCLKIKAIKLLYLKELFAPNQHSFEFYLLSRVGSGKLSLGCDPELSENHQVLKKIIFVPLKDLGRLRFYPQELKTRLKKDWQKKFKNVPVYLGAQRFTPKQYKRLFGAK